MTTIRDAIIGMRARAKAMHKPKPMQSATQEAVQALEDWIAMQHETSEEADNALLTRVRPMPLQSVSDRDVRKSIPPAWRQTDRSIVSEREWVKELTNEAVKRDTKRIDRALVLTWLETFPEGAGSSELAAAARVAANRRDWPYRVAGKEFDLWNRGNAAKNVGNELFRSGDPDEVLRRVALNPSIYSGKLFQASLEFIANAVATGSSGSANSDCNALLDLLDKLGEAGITSETRPLLMRGLLKPWVKVPPDSDLRVRIQKFALKEYGDPRFDAPKWLRLTNELTARGYSEDAEAIRNVVLRWLNRASFEIFFKLIGQSTSDPIQWAAREEFWRHYLEKDQITRAFFLLGSEAESKARPHREKLEEAGGYGRLSDDVDRSHSAFLMEIGDVIIAEWTHNASCCFWKPNAIHRPDFSNIRGKRFDGRLMRNTHEMQVAAARQEKSTGGQPLWAALAHTPKRLRGTRGWHSKFARHIRSWTGIPW